MNVVVSIPDHPHRSVEFSPRVLRELNIGLVLRLVGGGGGGGEGGGMM